MLRRDGSVVMISLRVMKKGKEVGGHAVYAFRDFIGRVRIMDRTGIYDDLNGMTGAYGVDEFVPRAAAHVQNVYAKMMNAGKAAVLAVGALGVVASERR